MNEALLLLAGLAFIVAFLLMLGVYNLIRYRNERSAVVKRINQEGPPEAKEAIQSGKKRLLNFIGSLGFLAKPKNEEEISHLRRTFLKAGIRKESATMIFFGAKVFLGLLFPVVFGAVRVMVIRLLPSVATMFIAFFLAVAGFYLPNLWLKLRIRGRKEKMLLGLPEALDLMVVCVEAGMGLDAAINRVGEEIKFTNKVVGEEFRLLSLELRAGKERKDALKNLAMRADLEEVNSLVSLVIQTDRFGTSIGQALRVHSDSMRVRRQQKAEEIASKLPVKLLFPLILFIFPSLFVAIMGPAVIRIARVLLPTLGGH